MINLKELEKNFPCIYKTRTGYVKMIGLGFIGILSDKSNEFPEGPKHIWDMEGNYVKVGNLYLADLDKVQLIELVKGEVARVGEFKKP